MAPDEQPAQLETDGQAPTADRPRLDQLFDADGLYALRSAVAAHASALGLVDPGLSDLVLVAHELATNAVRHGGANPGNPGRLRLWTGDGVVVCEVHDPGPGPADPAAVGVAPVDSAAGNGRGLWIVRQLAQRLDFSTGPAGSVVTAVLPIKSSTVDI